jgi:ubiquinone/menaquinone biosynthesis C-methylase UbiE
MPVLSPEYSQWLGALPRQGEDLLISPAQSFAHNETDYDRQYGVEPLNYAPGQGLVEAYRQFGGDFSAPALEIGCGTGLMSLGLVAQHSFPHTLLTDPSPAFLRITRNKLLRAQAPIGKTAFAILSADHMDRLPEKTFSLIGMRSVLHHVIDVERAIHATARTLQPGGMMVMEEPCFEGAVVMATIAQFMPTVVKLAGEEASPAMVAKVKFFTDTMKFYCRRDLDKSLEEDKHIFRVDELMKLAGQAGLSLEFCPNRTFYHWSPGLPFNTEGESFTSFFRDYFKYCMAFDEAFLALYDKHLAPYTKWIDELAMKNNGPYMHGVFVFMKK